MKKAFTTMPNEADNTVRIHTENQNIQKEVEGYILNEEGEFDFRCIIPLPSEPLNMHEGRYWRTRNWGTKCNAYHQSLEFRAREPGDIYFTSAWYTPMPIWEKIAQRFADEDVRLTVKFYEPNKTEIDCWDYLLIEDGMVSEVPASLGEKLHAKPQEKSDDSPFDIDESGDPLSEQQTHSA